MNRYLAVGVPTASPPSPDTIAWLDPDPSTLSMTVHGEWHTVLVRADLTKYLNDHVGVLGFGNVDGLLIGKDLVGPASSVEEACEDLQENSVHWRRAINQGLHLAACKEGRATIQVNHESDGAPPLAEYSFTIGPVSLPPPPSPPPTTTSTGGGGFGGFGPAPVAPSFRDGFRATRDVAENTPAGEAVGKPVVATHPDDLDLEYTLSGADAALFAIEVTDIDHGPYDLDDNERIERGEVIASISDYFKSIIGKDEVIQLIRLYFAG